MTFGFSDSSRNVRKLFFISWEVFVLHTRVRLNPLSSEILYHDRVSMIVPWFTSFVEDSVISFDQITKLLCSKYWIPSSHSAKSPRNLGSLAELAILVFWEVSARSGSEPSKISAGAGTSAISKFSVKSSCHSVNNLPVAVSNNSFATVVCSFLVTSRICWIQRNRWMSRMTCGRTRW